MKFNDNFTVIKCPVCGQEYLPSEIFYPDDLIGHPTEIIKTTSGRIDFFLGEDQDLEEIYTCDNCHTTFKVKANIYFNVEPIAKDFEEEYVTKIDKPKKYTLEEADLFNDNNSGSEEQ